ncbi:MAG: ABC transporter substrate-binding protein [Burkholderiales bacterium]
MSVALRAAAQTSAIPVVGFLCTANPEAWAQRVAAFRAGLAETGFVDGRDVTMEYRWADGRFERLPAMAADLVKRQVSLIAATGGTAAVQAAKAATSTIPVVFTLGNDPVKLGLVASLNRPGGNVTGVSNVFLEIAPKLLGVLRELAPKVTVVAFLVESGNPMATPQSNATLEAARGLGVQLKVVRVGADMDLDAAFASLDRLKVDAVMLGSDPRFLIRRDKVVALAARYRLPAIYFEREFVVAGGLASYGTNVVDSYRLAGVYAGRILKGAKPADLPILQPDRIELVINRTTAKSLGLTVPQALLLRADEVIQ